MVICPGIANHSEKQYIRTFVDYAQKNGYRCAVLNHLGALPNIELTSPRMFTYGKQGTWPNGALPLTPFSVVTESVQPLQPSAVYCKCLLLQILICEHPQEMTGHISYSSLHWCL